MSARTAIACLGAGRMGRGIAVVFAYAGHAWRIVDVKARDADGSPRLAAEAHGEVRATLATPGRASACSRGARSRDRRARVASCPRAEARARCRDAAVIFEGVPEVLDAKREVFARVSALAGPTPIIASTTSTILVDDLVRRGRASRALSQRPLAQSGLSSFRWSSSRPAPRTDPAVTERAESTAGRHRQGAGGMRGAPGYIVPRIQALAMNEAARMVEEGVASAEDIDKAIKYGFGLRFAVLGMLEFIDYGGGDILYYASRYLTGR